MFFSAFQFSVILWDSGVEVLSRHPCFIGSYYFKAIVSFWVIIQAGYNSILRHFLTRCNSSFHQQVICLSMVKAKCHTITANQNIFYWRLHSGESVWWKGMHTIHFKGLEIVRQFQMKKEWLIGWTDYIIVHCSKSVWLHGKRSYFSRL